MITSYVHSHEGGPARDLLSTSRAQANGSLQIIPGTKKTEEFNARYVYLITTV